MQQISVRIKRARVLLKRITLVFLRDRDEYISLEVIFQFNFFITFKIKNKFRLSSQYLL